MDVIAENIVAMKNCMKSNIPKHTKTFPIASVEKLNSLEALIDESNEKEYVSKFNNFYF